MEIVRKETQLLNSFHTLWSININQAENEGTKEKKTFNSIFGISNNPGRIFHFVLVRENRTKIDWNGCWKVQCTPNNYHRRCACACLCMHFCPCMYIRIYVTVPYEAHMPEHKESVRAFVFASAQLDDLMCAIDMHIALLIWCRIYSFSLFCLFFSIIRFSPPSTCSENQMLSLHTLHNTFEGKNKSRRTLIPIRIQIESYFWGTRAQHPSLFERRGFFLFSWISEWNCWFDGFFPCENIRNTHLPVAAIFVLESL